MIERIRNYIVLPILALLSIAAIYLSLVLCLYQVLALSPFCQELLWRYDIAKDISPLSSDARAAKLQTMIEQLPPQLLPDSHHKPKIIVTNNDKINAFAAPGGRIILTTGLFDAIASDAALLFVIGHEIGHLVQQDHLYQLSRSLIAKFYRIITMSSLLEELLMLIDLSKTKEDELAADQWALRIFLYYYGNLQGVDELLQILIIQEKATQQQRLITTHPSASHRLAKLNNLIRSP